MKFLERLLGDPNKKALKALEPILARVNSHADAFKALDDEQLKSKTEEFKVRLEKGDGLDDILPEAFAVVREAASRVLHERPYDVQVMGGIVLHQGKIAEMKTGEGKTLAATMPVYLNALTGRGVHVITVNDYLASRDAEWMGKIYEFLGLTVAAVTNALPPHQRKDAYACDIVYGTNNEFGFDYLRDNMAPRKEDQVQRELNFVIVDEVDSILIDEARTPLIISAPAEESAEHYKRFARVVPQLTANVDYTVDEKDRAANLTEEGIDKLQKLLGVTDIYESGNVMLAHHVEQALRAQALYKKDVDYVIKDGEIVIVDEFTGRLMVGRRYSEGLHQAIEAKEGVEIKRESRTLATITFQNYFRLYDKLSGMTGTAKTEEEEFFKIYGLEVVVIPTNQPIVRDDMNDLVFANERGKFKAVVEEIKKRNATGQPVLVGTIAIEKSEALSDLLKKEGVTHNVLNAKQHEREAEIVKDAGLKGAVTIATNMAGRGTDIKLGEGVRELGGLHILGTERHESRRIDNQLRGRAGRQGDAGSSQFFVSSQDDLMRLFGSEKMQNMMRAMKIPEDQPIEHKWITGSIESAQKRVEGHNFDIRKRVVEYDDVMNRHRTAIYKQRQGLLEQAEVKETLQGYIKNELTALVATYLGEDKSLWDKETLTKSVEGIFPLREDIKTLISTSEKREEVEEKLLAEAQRLYEAKEKEAGEEQFRQVERAVLLRVIDMLWMEHLDAMVRLREAIGLHGYAQKDPLVEYKQEAYQMFQRLQAAIASDATRLIYRVQVVSPQEQERRRQEQQAKQEMALKGADEPEVGFKDEEKDLKQKEKTNVVPKSEAEPSAIGDLDKKQKPVLDSGFHGNDGGNSSSSGSTEEYEEMTAENFSHKDKVGRNDPCPCGSGKKYKKCCGK
ncbi:MAG: preprotein translocase subunit SecA [Patescibacteria group bacterium]|nr:preprotein translocase subunit SecA [Patescibacteria group bacterium]